MKRIAVAGPYSTGGADAELRAARLAEMNRAALAVFEKGWAPVIGVNIALPVIETAGEERFAEIMQPLSNAVVADCAAILRIGGPSQGADEEVGIVRANGGAVYRAIEDVPDLT
ncbi:MAG: DUF4406 domain-containing protein [Pseudomonadota bacterium]